MAKNTIGQFLAALRKANGLTQQDVADRLNVSNKAVSRWERDECAPDISLIPALAEMFGVTCDELLKGERYTKSDFPSGKEQRVDKQIRALMNRSLSNFRTLIWISLSVAFVGLVCMFGISYGFYRPVIGFAVMMLLEAAAFAIAAIAVNKALELKTDNELFEMADDKLIEKFHGRVGTLSFHAFFLILSVILLSLPLILVESEYVNSVLTPYSYFTLFFGWIALLLSLVYLKCKKLYIYWITNGSMPQKPHTAIDNMRKKMSAVQIILTAAAGGLFVIAPYFETRFNDTAYVYIALNVVGLCCLAASIVTFAVFLIREKNTRKGLLLPGIRNILLVPSALILSGMHQISWWNGPGDTDVYRRETWYTEYFWYALSLAAVVWLVFALIETAIKRRSA